MPDLKKLMGPIFPLTHTRRYIAHEGNDEARKTGPRRLPALLVGRDEDIGWDCFAELTFRDDLHMQQFYARLNEEEVADKILQHEQHFSDVSKLRIVVMDHISTPTDYTTTKDE